MKKILLFLSLFYGSTAFSQTVANTPPDIVQCNPNIFMDSAPPVDLTQQTPLILGGLNPSMFTVSYYESEADAGASVNAIAQPEQYTVPAIVPQYVTIYARVENNNDESYAIVHFTVTDVSLYDTEPTLIVCEGYDVPDLNIGEFYSEPGGQGMVYASGTIVPQFTHLYAYAEYEGCILEFDFIAQPDFVHFDGPLEPLTGCDENMDGIALFNLASLIEGINGNNQWIIVTFHQTHADAEDGVNAIATTSAYQNILPYTETLYVRKYDGTCHSVTSLELIAGDCEGASVTGMVTYDLVSNECNTGAVGAPGLPVSFNNGITNYVAFTDSNGNYGFVNIPEAEGTLTVGQGGTFPFTTTPGSYTLSPEGEEQGYNFCLSAEDNSNNLSVTMVPLGNAIPGFDTYYQLVIQNTGSTPADGTITITFNDASLTFNSSSPAMTLSGNVLTYNFAQLMPFQSVTAAINFTVFTPPTVNGGDILEFTAALSGTDDIADDNVSIVNQTVVNSYDPNDITVHEGAFISPEQAEGYLHYTIRFQNEGNGNAINIRVDDMLDDNLDWDTFQPVASSHNMQTMRTGNMVQFYFNNINLPYTDADEAGSQGYISYRIKPVSSIAEGDIIMASAGIYFDFNPVVLTNTTTTTVQTAASAKDFNNTAFVVYPNPASGKVSILAENLTGEADVVFTDVLGKTVLTAKLSGNSNSLDVNSLHSGMYFIRISTEGKSSTQKLIIK